MEFFDKLGKKASEAYKVTADKTGKLAREAKLRMKMGELKSEINNIYEEIGKKIYENHVREEKEDISKDVEEQCTKIDCLSDEIESILKECLELKDKRQCSNCYAELDKDVKFCQKSGAKQDNEEKSNLEKTVAVESDVDENHDETVEHIEEEDE